MRLGYDSGVEGCLGCELMCGSKYTEKAQSAGCLADGGRKSSSWGDGAVGGQGRDGKRMRRVRFQPNHRA